VTKGVVGLEAPTYAKFGFSRRAEKLSYIGIALMGTYRAKMKDEGAEVH